MGYRVSLGRDVVRATSTLSEGGALPVPSAFAAAAAEKGKDKGGAHAPVQAGGTGIAAEQGLLKPRAGLRPIPFD